MSKTTTTTEATAERFTVTGTGKKWYVVIDGVRDQSVTYPTKTEATANAADMAKAAAKAERAAARAAKAAAKQPAPTAETPVPVDYSKLSKVELLKLAKAERTAKQAARDAGEPAPATPVLDWMATGDADAAFKKSRRSSGGAKAPFRSPEQDAQMVAVITAGIAEGKSWVKIAEDLDAAQVPTRSGGRWWFGTAHSTAMRLGLHTPKAREATAA